MTDWDPVAFENAIIADMRANEGAVTSGPLAGKPLLILNTVGAKTGQPRRSILTFSRDGAAYVVAGTKNGAPTDPFWLGNLAQQPKVTVEAEGRTFEASATITDGPDRDRLWDDHVAALPNFAEYPAQSGRVIPMVRLTPS